MNIRYAYKEIATLSLAMTNTNMMSKTIKILIVIGCIILGYVMMGFGWSSSLPSGLGQFLFFGGMCLVLCSGVYGLVKVIKSMKKSIRNNNYS
jgi:hypothetical protein